MFENAPSPAERLTRSALSLALLSISLLAGSAALQAANSPKAASLAGRVVDPSGAGVPAAEVEVEALDGRFLRSATTDRQGQFSLSSLRRGGYLLKVTAQGFSTTVRRVEVVPGVSTDLEINLPLAAIEDKVIVVASGRPQNAADSAKSVTVLSRDQLDGQGEFALADALRLAPSMMVSQVGGPGAFTTVKTRGLRNQDTAFLIDGIRFRDAAAIEGDATAFLENLQLAGLERIEVQRGSGSSLHGSNAIAGVVNLVSESGGGDTEGLLEVEGGGLGLLRGLGRISGGSEDGSIAFSAALTHLNISDGVDGNDALRNTSLRGGFDWSPRPETRLRARLLAVDAFSQLNDSSFAAPGATLPPSGVVEAVPLPQDQIDRLLAGETPDFGRATYVPDLDDPDNQRNSLLFNSLLQWDHRLPGGLGYTLSYGFTSTDRQFTDGPGGQQFEPSGNTLSELDGRIHLLRAELDYRLGRHHAISAGYEYERQRFLSRDLSSDVFSSAQATESSHAFFIQDQMRFLSERLEISLAGRAQSFRLLQPAFQGGISPYQDISAFDSPPTAYTADGSIAYFFPASGTKIRGHVGNGYRAPSLFNRLGTTFFAGSFSPLGDPRLRPERSVSFDAGFDQTLADQRVRFSATYFYTRLQESIVFDFLDASSDPFGRFGGYSNDRGGISRGVELEWAFSPLPIWDLSASYTYTNSDLSRDLAGTGFATSLGVPEHLFVLASRVRPTARLELNFHLYATSSYLHRFFVDTGNRDFRFDGRRRADLGANYRVWVNDHRKVRLYVQVENLFDQAYFETGFRTPGLTARAGVAYEY
ncbi:MAG TPA: TonB-dependent receptor [Acidobacteriota bacterium]|nr:TonB-dependent receptor [Acidobacteriota bacterium]